MTTRINETFKNLKQTNSKAFVAYVMGGDPDRVTSQKMLNALPDSGVDIIELGMPFTDPAADGPIIEEAGLRHSRQVLNYQLFLRWLLNFVK